MSRQTDLLRELTSLINARAPIPVERFFTENFTLSVPSASLRRSGHAGARDMIDAFLAIAPDVRLKILDMIEQGDRVAVRWIAETGTGESGSSLAMLAIYRFEGGRIAEDWGLAAAAPW